MIFVRLFSKSSAKMFSVSRKTHSQLHFRDGLVWAVIKLTVTNKGEFSNSCREVWTLCCNETESKKQNESLSNLDFMITAEIHARSLAKCYGQYADRHMNLKFVRRASEREREIRQSVIVKNKLMSVFNASVLLLTMNFVITL